MSYREKENLVNIFSGILITSIYSIIIYQRHLEGRFDLTQDFQKWGVIFLVFMGVSIIARIIIYVVFHILNAIATREQDIPVTDERDKLIKLKATRNSYHTFTIIFAMALIALSIGMPVYGLLISFIGAGLMAEIVENISQIYFYRKGI